MSELFLVLLQTKFKKWCNFDKSWIIFSGKRFSTTWQFQMFENESIFIKCSNLFMKILFWKIFFWWSQRLKNLFWKIKNCQFVENLFPEKMIRELLESCYFLKFGLKRYEKKFRQKCNKKISYWMRIFDTD